MVVSDTKLKRAISLAIIERFTQADWTLLGLQTGTSDVINGHPRLLRSLFFEDNDYPSNVASVLTRMFREIGAPELVKAIEDIIDLPTWLHEAHPKLYQDIYGSEFDESLLQLEEEGIALGVHDIPRHIARIRRSVDTDPDQAIGSSKELLESVIKTILDDRSVAYRSTDDMRKLLKEVRQQLDLESGRTGNARDRILNGLTAIASGVTELRNLHGTRHGRSRTREPDIAYAHLVVSSSAAIARFLMDTHSAKQPC